MLSKKLFNDSRLADYFAQSRVDINSEIDSLGRDSLDEDPGSIINNLINKYKLETPVIKNYDVEVKGQDVEYTQDYEGSGALFTYEPSRITTRRPIAYVIRNALILRYPKGSKEDVKAQFENDISNLSKWLGFMDDDIVKYNADIEAFIPKKVDKKLKELERDIRLEEDLRG